MPDSTDATATILDAAATAAATATGGKPGGKPDGKPDGKPADGATAAAPAAAPATDWATALPESLRPLAAEAKDMAGLEAALKRGLAHIPLENADDVEVPLPEGIDAEQLKVNTKWFRDLAVEHKFSKSQVKALVDAYNKEVMAAPARMSQEAEKTLKAEYGDEYAAKIARANDVARRFDQMCGGTDTEPGALGKILRMGLGNQPDFIRAMVMISESVSDSAMPGVSHGGGGGVEAVSTEQFLNDIMAGKNS